MHLHCELKSTPQRETLAINAPLSFEPALLTLANVTMLRDPIETNAVHFALAFVKRQAAVDLLAPVLADKAKAATRRGGSPV